MGTLTHFISKTTYRNVTSFSARDHVTGSQAKLCLGDKDGDLELDEGREQDPVEFSSHKCGDVEESRETGN